MSYRIPFNKPFIAGKELFHIAQAVLSGHLSGDGPYAKRCQELLEDRFSIPHALLTPSCSGALDLAGALCGLEPGTEVILPSYTFTSTANSVVRYGAHPVFVDIRPDTLNLDETLIEAAVTERTRAVFVVHYAGVACEMDPVLETARRHGLRVVEDAAQGLHATYRGDYLGTIGDLGTFSFHETKNVISGEGGALLVNDGELLHRAEILREKGTNRSQFFRGEVDKYTWHEPGYSELPSEIVAAFLYGQLEHLDEIRERRLELWRRYALAFTSSEAEGRLRLPRIPSHCGHNAHLFYLLLPDEAARDGLIAHLKEKGILAVFHYVPLHLSPMGQKLGYRSGQLPVTEDLYRRLVRLPLYFTLSDSEQDEVIEGVTEFLGAG